MLLFHDYHPHQAMPEIIAEQFEELTKEGQGSQVSWSSGGNAMIEVDTQDALIASLSRSDQLRVILETSPAAMVVIDQEGIIRGFGKAAQKLFGYPEGTAIGQNVSILMAQPHAARHNFYLKRYHATRERRMMGFTRVENACDCDGHVFPVEITLGEAEADGETYYIGFLRDVGKQLADRRQLRTILDELAHASRISAMGAFATAIAHELNQPLTTINNYAEGLRDILARRTDLADREQLVEILDSCSKQAVRAGQLIHRLRDFVRGAQPRIELADAEELINSSVTLAMINGFRRDVRLETVLPSGLPPVCVDPVQAQQVMFNLMRNAFEAMHIGDGSSGRLRIEALMHDENHVEFVVEDNGPGIDPQVADRIFESFMTTKGGGMGVGLAICKQIVESHGGAIWANRSPSLGGAAFHFTLPAGRANDGVERD
jgi:two-component system sensor kinase FixL